MRNHEENSGLCPFALEQSCTTPDRVLLSSWRDLHVHFIAREAVEPTPTFFSDGSPDRHQNGCQMREDKGGI